LCHPQLWQISLFPFKILLKKEYSYSPYSYLQVYDLRSQDSHSTYVKRYMSRFNKLSKGKRRLYAPQIYMKA